MRISHATRQLIRAINALALLVGIVAIVLLLASFYFATREAGEALCFVAVTGVVLTDSLLRRSAATPRGRHRPHRLSAPRFPGRVVVVRWDLMKL